MKATTEQILAKLEGTVSGLKSMSPKERQAQPTREFLMDYNKAREIALQLHSDLSDLFPPEAQIGSGTPFEDAGSNYVEILCFSQQLLGFLPKKSKS